jgi:hypothetical protein
MKHLLSLMLCVLALPLAAAPHVDQLRSYVDSFGTSTIFWFGSDVGNNQYLTFPPTVTPSQIGEVSALYRHPTILIEPLLPAGALVGDATIITGPRTPSSSNDFGITGTISWDANYFYVCTAPSHWGRVPLDYAW